MRSAVRKRRVDEDDDEVDAASSPRPWWWRLLLRRPADTVAFLVVTAAAATIVINASYLQHGRHPAPIFAIRPLPIAADRTDSVSAPPAARPHEPVRHEPARPNGEGADAKPRPAATVGPRKDAIADLLATAPTQSARPAAPPPTRALTPTASAQPVPPAPIPTPRSPAHPSRQVLAVQRALSEYGYGQLKPTGVYDADTRLAIQRFERDRKLPITGEISERVTRELASLTGRELN